MSAANEWARRQLIKDDYERQAFAREMRRMVDKQRHWDGLTFWGKIKHYFGFTGERR